MSRANANIFLILLLVSCTFSVANGQSINYEKIGFSRALQKAQNYQQIIFIQLTSDCERCDQVAEDGLSGKDIEDIFSKFICIKVINGTDEYVEILKRYRISPSLPTSLFLDHQGNFLNMIFNKSTSRDSEYIKAAARAMSLHNDPPLKAYEAQYASGDYDITFLEDFIIELSKNKFDTDDLLEEYVGKLTVDSLFSIPKIRFILESSPYVGSRIFKLIKLDNKLYDSAFWSFDLDERIGINRKIISKSREKAFKEKDPSYMSEVAAFIFSSYMDRKDGAKASLNFRLDFYGELKDTNMYMRTAQNYYNQYLKQLDMDSVSIAEKAKYIDMGNGGRKTGAALWTTGNRINKIAWTMYELTDDLEYLGRALKLAESILVYKHPAYYDTYAHILYRLGGRSDAIEWQQKAIDLHNSRISKPDIALGTELQKMKDGEL